MERYSTEKVEAIAQKLREMPQIEQAKREVSKSEAVRMLAKEILALQKRGYTIEQIAETLRGEGMDITTPTLKSYLQRTKALKTRKSKQSNESNSSTSDAAAEKAAGRHSDTKDTPPPPPPAQGKGRFTARDDSDDI